MYVCVTHQVWVYNLASPWSSSSFHSFAFLHLLHHLVSLWYAVLNDSQTVRLHFVSYHIHFRTYKSPPVALHQLLNDDMCSVSSHCHLSLSVHWPLVHVHVLCSNHLSFFTLSLLHGLRTFLPSLYFHNYHPSLIIFSFHVLPSSINLNVMPPHLCPPSLCPPPPLLCLCSPRVASNRPGEPAPPAGQCHAGCQWLVPANGGDGEASCSQSPPGRERALLYIH